MSVVNKRMHHFRKNIHSKLSQYEIMVIFVSRKCCFMVKLKGSVQTLRCQGLKALILRLKLKQVLIVCLHVCMLSFCFSLVNFISRQHSEFLEPLFVGHIIKRFYAKRHSENKAAWRPRFSLKRGENFNL